MVPPIILSEKYRCIFDKTQKEQELIALKTKKTIEKKMDKINEDLDKLEDEETFVQNMIDSDHCVAPYDKSKNLTENHYEILRMRRLGEEANQDNFINQEQSAKTANDFYK